MVTHIGLTGSGSVYLLFIIKTQFQAVPFVTLLILNAMFILGWFINRPKWLVPLLFFYEAVAFLSFCLCLAVLSTSIIIYMYAYLMADVEVVIINGIPYHLVDKRNEALSNMQISAIALFIFFWSFFNAWAINKARLWLMNRRPRFVNNPGVEETPERRGLL